MLGFLPVAGAPLGAAAIKESSTVLSAQESGSDSFTANAAVAVSTSLAAQEAGNDNSRSYS